MKGVIGMNKKYIISEEELKSIISTYANPIKTRDEYLKDFLKSKQPVEEIASGEVSEINFFSC
ncbi:MAG: hypothetical protein FJW61_09620, partial [Actinobacteria bacterium]|nr:hypothetical protein [Actinomycetota bacterium]